MRWFFEVAPKLAPSTFQKTSKLLPFYAKYKAQGKNAVQDFPWFCDVDKTPNATMPTIQKGMFMQDWDALQSLVTSQAPTTETKETTQAPPTVVVREKTTNDIDKTKTIQMGSTEWSTGQKVAIAVVSVAVVGGFVWWLTRK